VLDVPVPQGRQHCSGSLSDTWPRKALQGRHIGRAPSQAEIQATCEVLRAVASPVRLAVILELAQQPRCVHDLVAQVHASQPVISQHLRVLRAMRLVRSERRGREVLYSLADDHVAHIARDALRHVQEGTREP
jgi:DNA-binding transcriptional ArsR family regulator